MDSLSFAPHIPQVGKGTAKEKRKKKKGKRKKIINLDAISISSPGKSEQRDIRT